MSVVKSWDPGLGRAQPVRFGGSLNAATEHVANRHATRPDPTTPSDDVSISSPKAAHSEELAKLKELVRSLEERLEASDALIERRQREGFEAGKAEGLKLAEAQSAAQKALLDSSLCAAGECFEKHLNEQVEVGLAFAVAVVQNVLGDESAMPSHVIDTATIWREKLSDSVIVSLSVSQADFPGADELSALEKGHSVGLIKTDAELKSGECLFELQLGHLDASIPTQMSNALKFLTDLSFSRGRS